MIQPMPTYVFGQNQPKSNINQLQKDYKSITTQTSHKQTHKFIISKL